MYDPQQKTLLADKGEIRVGGRYQVDHIPPVIKPSKSGWVEKGIFHPIDASKF